MTGRCAEGARPAPERRALLVLTRDPGGELSGRKTVLATIASSVERLGFAVEVVVLSRTSPGSSWLGRPVHHVPLPSLRRVATTAATVLLTRRGSLNEALFDAPPVRRAVVDVAKRSQSTVVIADTLRTYGPAQATGLPVVVHLDDLLSDRYQELAKASSSGDLLGFFAEQIPGFLRVPATAVSRRLLAIESRLLAAREVEVVHQAAGAAVTSPDEALELERRTGRRVPALPMAVDVRPPGSLASANSFAFLGLMSYTPNSEAVRWWRDHVRPELDRLGGEDVVLTVIGGCKDEHRRELEDGRIRLTGYVEDLDGELRRHRGFVAPVQSGTGLKTKVLDAFSVGLPVVATPMGVSGLAVVHGTNALIASNARQFAEEVLRLRDDQSLAARIGNAGREFLASTWSSVAVAEGWAAMLVPDTPSPARPRTQ